MTKSPEDNKSSTVTPPNASDDANEVGDTGSDDGEFKITVRKLEMPVRPRGVLAE